MTSWGLPTAQGVQADGTAIAATELQPLHNFFPEVSFNTFDHKKMPCGVSKLIQETLAEGDIRVFYIEVTRVVYDRSSIFSIC